MPRTRSSRMPQNNPNNAGNAAAAAGAVEPYKLSEIFSVVPEYDGNQILLNTFIQACSTAFNMAIGNQKVLVTLHIKNKLKGRAAELINSREPKTWQEIKTLLENHFGDTRDLTSLIQDLQRLKQSSSESPLTFVARLQTHEAKLYASINKQTLTAEEKAAQTLLVESMALNTLLAGLDPKIGQIVRASNPPDILTATNRIRRELQLNYFENQKFNLNRNTNIPPRKQNPNQTIKNCSICKRTGHSNNECRQRMTTPQTFSNFQHNNQNQFRPQQPFQNPQQRPFYQQQNTSQNPNFQNRPPVIRPNPNIGSPRPSAIQPNPNFNKYPAKTHHLNYNNSDSYEQYYDTDEQNYFYLPNDEQYYQDQPQLDFPTEMEQNQDFPLEPSFQTDPPNQDILEITSQIQTLNMDNFDPNLNFPEQNFL